MFCLIYTSNICFHVDDDLFGDEDDLFASKSKPIVPSITKPVKQDNNVSM